MTGGLVTGGLVSTASDPAGTVIEVRGVRNQFGAQVVHDQLDLDVRRWVEQGLKTGALRAALRVKI